jgi:FkbM family methyltransferase
MTIQEHIKALAAEELTFAQIGAGGPVSNDFLMSLLGEFPLWRGVFMEPLGRVVEKLKAQYGEKYIIRQCAISDFTGTAPFYYFATDAAQLLNGMIAGSRHFSQEQLDMFGSCNKEQVAECYRWAEVTNIVEILMGEGIWLEKKIEFETLGNVLDAHNMNPQLLIIDTEGADERILRDIDYDKFDLKILVYEHTWCHERSRDAIEGFLLGQGYKEFIYYKGTGGQRCDKRSEADNTLIFR